MKKAVVFGAFVLSFVVFGQAHAMSLDDVRSALGLARIAERQMTPQVLGAATSTIVTKPLTVSTKRSDEVIKLQYMLNKLGYLDAIPDGVFGPKTTAAVAAFQAANGLSPVGVVDDKTLALINSSDVLGKLGAVSAIPTTTADIGMIPVSPAPTTPTTLPPCSIVSFTATPAVVTPGGYTTLSWTTTGCTNALLNNVDFVLPNSSVTLGPITTGTTYQFKAASLRSGCKWTGGTNSAGQSCMAPVIATSVTVPVSTQSGKDALSTTTSVDALVKNIPQKIEQLQWLQKNPSGLGIGTLLPTLTTDAKNAYVALLCVYNPYTNTYTQYANAASGAPASSWVVIHADTPTGCYHPETALNPYALYLSLP
mgnify:CR=1 FL=1